MNQDASKNGAMLFELTTPAGRRVHSGILDFSAAPVRAELLLLLVWDRKEN